ncbi:TetR/AcrR family transcriptional regulator [Breznakia pachnodae]|uniref:AcrR family transcriptional regulator n=1 Tax=Breznakia pachnodae TaxID=265178 RepID=A0ABU0E501_9FIRM|nr:TetR/AcrR family transcriptional regulator [Breznakia pachnodae]MDQ0361978.1 AcrR family transcriptional regulator [Breznakia pachnodae]
MKKNDTKQKLIDTTKQLLSEEDYKNITAREISKRADVNLAMINYNFESKDELVKLAVNEIISEEFSKNFTLEELTNDSSKEQLKKLLYHTCEITLKYKELTQLSIPYILLNEEIKLPFDLLPFFLNYYGTTKSESQCKVLAFQLVYSLQLIFYRYNDFYNYSGINILNKDELHKFIDFNVDTFLTGGN